MSLYFDGANDSLENSDGCAGIDTATKTIACWAYAEVENTGTLWLTAASVTGGQYRYAVQTYAPASSGWRVYFTQRFSGADGEWYASGDISLNRWYHICIVYDHSSTSNAALIYIDGSSVAVTQLAGPTGSATTSTDSLIFGENVGHGQDYQGYLAEWAYWDVELTAAEVASLGMGYAPSLVRPNSLIMYCPFIRSSQDVIQGVPLTANAGAPTPSAHPRIIYPSRQRIFVPGAAAGGLGIPIAAYHYNHHLGSMSS